MNGLTNGKEKMGDKIHKSFLAAIVILAVGAVDYSTVYQLSFSIFYLIPILLLTRTWGIGGGTAGSVASAGMWLWISLISPKYSYGAILTPYFNACVRLCFFLIITWIIDKWEKEKTRSRIDPLTGLANRTAFYEMTELEKKRGQRYQRPLSIAYLDVDNFKTINDRFGHRRGDESLRFIAQLIRRNIRASDFVSRLGGDEFIILMPETSEPAAHIALVRLQRLLALKENRGTQLTVSIGTATFNPPLESVDEMLHIADGLMYRAKKTGKNHIEQATIRTKTDEKHPPAYAKAADGAH